MGYLRLQKSQEPEPSGTASCLEVFDEQLDYVFVTLRRLGVHPAEIEDLVQEVFIVLHRNWSALDTSRSLRPYLFGVAFRIVCAQKRRRSREVCAPYLELVDDAMAQDRALQSRESAALLSRALQRVPLPRRAVLIMHELDEVPVREIARTIDMTTFGVHARLRKGRSELARAVRELETTKNSDSSQRSDAAAVDTELSKHASEARGEHGG